MPPTITISQNNDEPCRVTIGSSRNAAAASKIASAVRAMKKKPTARGSKMPACTRRWRSTFMLPSLASE